MCFYRKNLGVVTHTCKISTKEVDVGHQELRPALPTADQEQGLLFLWASQSFSGHLLLLFSVK